MSIWLTNSARSKSSNKLIKIGLLINHCCLQVVFAVIVLIKTFKANRPHRFQRCNRWNICYFLFGFTKGVFYTDSALKLSPSIPIILLTYVSSGGSMKGLIGLTLSFFGDRFFHMIIGKDFQLMIISNWQFKPASWLIHGKETRFLI